MDRTGRPNRSLAKAMDITDASARHGLSCGTIMAATTRVGYGRGSQARTALDRHIMSTT
jgi:hypothetical protein